MNTGELLGRKVEDRNGREIGSLEEIVVDRLTGRVKFAVVELDEGRSSDSYLPVPWSAVSATSNDDSVRIDLVARRLPEAPRVDAEKLGSLERREVGVEVYSYYGLQPPWEGATPGDESHAGNGT